MAARGGIDQHITGWERGLPVELIPQVLRFGLAGRPYRAPDMPDPLPAARPALAAAVGGSVQGDILVIPPSARQVSPGRVIYTPPLAMGAGPRAVALWAALPQPRVVATVPLAGLAAVTTRHTLVRGRASLAGAGSVLSFGYEPRGQQAVDEALAAVRRRCWARPMQVPVRSHNPLRLPYRWRRLLAAPATRPDTAGPVALEFGHGAAGHGECLVAATGHELVIARTPPSITRISRDRVDVPAAQARHGDPAGPRQRPGTLR